MDLNIRPDFRYLARFSIETFHPEILEFPETVVKMAIEYKALQLEEVYEAMLHNRK